MKMKKYIKASLAFLAICATLSGCGKPDDTVPQTDAQSIAATSVQEASEEDTSVPENFANLPQATIKGENPGLEDMLTDYYDDYAEAGGMIAYVTNVSKMEDGTFNQTVYDGIRLYANSAGVSYSYYIPDGSTNEAYQQIVDKAIEDGSSLIVCSGVHFEQIIGEYQHKFPDISFLMIDGTPKDESGNDIPLEANVHCATFREEESSYIAGYCTVLDGYRKLGFIGGEKVPPVQRFGYGYLRGIDDAATALECTEDIEVYYWYSGSFLPLSETKQMADSWYSDGCEIIFCCGGSLYESVLEAADEADKQIIGVDVDQSPISERVLTSAMKGVDRAVVKALDDFFAFGKWSDEMGGHVSDYGIREWCGGIPTTPWRFEHTSQEDFGTLYLGIKEGTITIPHDVDSFPSTAVKVTHYDEY